MAAKQRDISVSEFFAKNRHLLGFDNPRKALLTTVKEAVDNSLDACEEAGILPEIWVHIEQTGNDRYKVGVQDNGPGIVKKQIPLIFGKLLYGSKFHRLRQSRGQQGIGISAAGMYGVQTTGKPVKIISRVAAKKPAHYYEIQIDTKKNQPQILNGGGEGVDIPPGEKGAAAIDKHGIEWVEQPHGTRVTIELAAKFVRGRGSVDEYLTQTAIANPHVTLHYLDPEGNRATSCGRPRCCRPSRRRSSRTPTAWSWAGWRRCCRKTRPAIAQFLTSRFSRVTSGVARKVCARPRFRRGQNTQDRPQGSRRVVPRDSGHADLVAGHRLHLADRRRVDSQGIASGRARRVLRRRHAAARRVSRQSVSDRSRPGLRRSAAMQHVTKELLRELIEESDARTIRQFLIHTFNGLGSDAADRIMQESRLGTRQSPSGLKPKEVEKLLAAMKGVNVSEGQTMEVFRYANRVPLQFQPAGCAITQTVLGTNWRSYGLSQSRGSLPKGPVTMMIHIASVWVPFTSESKEAVASYPEIQKELRLALQSVGRKLGMYVRRRMKVKQQGERRQMFLRYLGEVATAVSEINRVDRQHCTINS